VAAIRSTSTHTRGWCDFEGGGGLFPRLERDGAFVGDIGAVHGIDVVACIMASHRLTSNAVPIHI
jgi:hypothetical protein